MTPDSLIEGLIRFHLHHDQHMIDLSAYSSIIEELSAWRALFYKLSLIGQNQHKYHGAGYGNVSARIPPFDTAPNYRSFVITASQTAHQAIITPHEYTRVHHYDFTHYTLHAQGHKKPSSESMTHAALYDVNPHIRFVFHVHAPVIWHHAQHLNLVSTPAHIVYGSRGMAEHMKTLYQNHTFSMGQVLVMGGHQDGIISCGASASQAGQAVINAWLKAQKYM